MNSTWITFNDSYFPICNSILCEFLTVIKGRIELYFAKFFSVFGTNVNSGQFKKMPI